MRGPQPEDYLVLITDPAGSDLLCDPIEIGDPRTGTPGYQRIHLGPRRNEPGVGVIDMSARPDVLAAVNTPDARAVVLRDTRTDGHVLEMAGPIEQPRDAYEAAEHGDGPSTLKITFVDDFVLLTERLVYPDPTRPATEQTTTTRYVITDAAVEDAVRDLVDYNAGPQALVDRQTPGLVLGPLAGDILPDTTVSTSFGRDVILSDAVREVLRLGALAAGTWPRVPRAQIIPAGGQLEFRLSMPPDLSAEVIYSRDAGTLAAYTWEPEPPVHTVAIVGDATAGTGRVISERVNSGAHAAGWRRREVWVDARGAANLDEQEQAGDDVLAEGAARTRMTFVPVPGVERPPIGSLVTVEPYPGAYVPVVVLGEDITISPQQGARYAPVLGVDGDQVDDRKAAEIRHLMRRIGALESAL